MNLKTIAPIAALLVLVSIPVSLFGLTITLAYSIMQHSFWSNAVNMGVSALKVLLSSGGLLIFFWAYAKQAAGRPVNMRTMLIVAGSMVSGGLLLEALMSLPLMVKLSQFLPRFDYCVFLTIAVASLVWVICLCAFIFSQLTKTPASKVLAVIALGALCVLCVMTLIRLITSPPWEHPSKYIIVSNLVATLGFYVGKFGAGLFLLAYLISPTEPVVTAAAPTFSEPAL